MERLRTILEGIRPEFDFSKSDDFITDGLLDSFDVVMLVAALDEEFSISIEGTDITPENLKSAATIRRLLEKYGVIL